MDEHKDVKIDLAPIRMVVEGIMEQAKQTAEKLNFYVDYFTLLVESGSAAFNEDTLDDLLSETKQKVIRNAAFLLEQLERVKSQLNIALCMTELRRDSIKENWTIEEILNNKKLRAELQELKLGEVKIKGQFKACEEDAAALKETLRDLFDDNEDNYDPTPFGDDYDQNSDDNYGDEFDNEYDNYDDYGDEPQW